MGGCKLYFKTGKVTTVSKNVGVKVIVMKPTFAGYWKWPERRDEIFYTLPNIVKKIAPPVPVDSRGQFKFENRIC